MRHILDDRTLPDGRRRVTVAIETRVIPKPGNSAVGVSRGSNDYHRWKTATAEVLLVLMRAEGMEPFPSPGIEWGRNLTVQIHVGGHHLGGDFDNYGKAVVDLLQDLQLIQNDRFIRRGSIAVREGGVDFFWARIWGMP